MYQSSVLNQLQRESANISKLHNDLISRTEMSNGDEESLNSCFQRKMSGKIMSIGNSSVTSSNIPTNQDIQNRNISNPKFQNEANQGNAQEKSFSKNSFFTSENNSASNNKGFQSKNNNTSSYDDEVFEKFKEERDQLVVWGRALYREVKKIEREREELIGKYEELKENNQNLLSMNKELVTDIENKNKTNDQFEYINNLKSQIESYGGEIDRIRNELNSKNDQNAILIADLKNCTQERDNLKKKINLLIEEIKIEKSEHAVKKNLLNEQRVISDTYKEKVNDSQHEIEVLKQKVLEEKQVSIHWKTRYEDEEKCDKNSVIENLIILNNELKENNNQLTHDFTSLSINMLEQLTSFRVKILDAINEAIETKTLTKKSEATFASFANIIDDLQKKLSNQGNYDSYEPQNSLDEENYNHNQLILSHSVVSERDDISIDKKLTLRDLKLRKLAQTRQFKQRTSIVPYLKVLFAGSNVLKSQVHTNNKKCQIRFIILTPDLKVRWGNSQNFTKKELHVKDIISVTYGSNTRIAYYNTNINPLCCFSFSTRQRTFDFMTESEYECNAWVISLSRLLNTQNNYILAIPFSSKSLLYVQKVKEKLNTYCKKKNVSIVDIFRDAIKRTFAFGSSNTTYDIVKKK